MTDDDRTCLLTYLRAYDVPERIIVEAVAQARSPADGLLRAFQGDTFSYEEAKRLYPTFWRGWVAGLAEGSRGSA